MIDQALRRHELTVSRKTGHGARTQDSAEQDTSRADAAGGQKKPHAPRTKKAQDRDGANSLHLIYDQPGIEHREGGSGEDSEHA